jgi:phosphoribosylformylglycinamidine (FGAM) synthase PurS component
MGHIYFLNIIDEELPIMIQLEVDDSDMDQWENNVDGIRERFLANLCEALDIPSENIHISMCFTTLR